MPKAPCNGVKKDGTPCRGNGLPDFDGYCIAHAPADKTRAWRTRGGKNSSTAARADKRIPDRLRGAIEALEQGLLDVRAGNLDPAAYSAMCRGVKAMVDLYRLADEEMELIRNEETEATAMEVVGDHGDPAILNAAAQIAAQQNQYRIESLIDQGLATLEQSQDADQPAQPVLTDKGRRRFGYQRLTNYTQEDLDNLKYLLMERGISGRQIPDLRDALAKMRAAIEEALADLARNPAPPLDSLTGQPLSRLPAGVKTGPLPPANPDSAGQAAKILEDQLQQTKMLTREFKELYEDELVDDTLDRLTANSR